LIVISAAVRSFAGADDQVASDLLGHPHPGLHGRLHPSYTVAALAEHGMETIVRRDVGRVL
ncbi:hypothetical protein ABZ672_53245, partial [Streptomyces mirabilis]